MAELSEDEIKRQLQQMDPYEFEELVAEIWESQGYQTTVRKGSGDRGIDIEATMDIPFSQRVIIQAKRYGESNKIDSETVRKYATLRQQVSNADNIVIVTTSVLTEPARSLAKELGVKAVEIPDIINLIMDNNLCDLVSEEEGTNSSMPERYQPNNQNQTEQISDSSDNSRYESIDRIRTQLKKEGIKHIDGRNEDFNMKVISIFIESLYEHQESIFSIEWDSGESLTLYVNRDKFDGIRYSMMDENYNSVKIDQSAVIQLGYNIQIGDSKNPGEYYVREVPDLDESQNETEFIHDIIRHLFDREVGKISKFEVTQV